MKRFVLGLMLALLAALPARAQITPASGYWWDPAQPGRGFVIEIQGTTMFMAGFLYAASGESTWVGSTGPMTTATQYSGPLSTYSGGQTLTGAYQPATENPVPVGTITINFTSNTTATLAWPGGTIPIQRFDIVPGGSTTAQPATNPQTGWWWNPAEGGRGFAIEIQNGTMYFAGYMYDASGNPLWYLSSGSMSGVTGNALFQGEWQQYGNGQTLTGAYQTASIVNAAVGPVTLQFSGTTNATLTLPGGRQIPFTRFIFGTGTTPYTANVAPIIVDAGPTVNGQTIGDTNVGFVSVTICVPGTSNCQTIDHIDVDTGSSGLRILASVLSLGLPQQTNSSGGKVVECTQFADGFTWGPIKLVDLTISGEQAKSLPIQVIGDPSFSNVPADCSNSGPAEDTVTTFGANGIIGVGNFQADCGMACASEAISGAYYACESGECLPSATPTALQVQNPVGFFATDNNGVLIQMASVPANGALTASGSLIFGIGTQSNNGLGSAKILNVDPQTGYLNVIVNNATYTDSYIDSGSSAFFLPQSFATGCPPNSEVSGYLCPPNTVNFNAIVQGSSNGVSTSTSFSVANAQALANAEPNFNAFNNIAAVNGDDSSVDLGLPFFFGRSIFAAIEGKQTPGGAGPFVAF